MRVKARFYCWLIVALLATVYCLHLALTNFHLNSNILELLPKSDQNLVTNNAINKFSSTAGRQLIFLVGNSDQATAERAADNFYQELQQDPLLNNISYLVNSNEQQAWGAFYFPYRLSLLTAEQKQLLQQNKIQQIEQAALMNLYSPMGISNAALLSTDPYFLLQHYLLSLPNPAHNLSLREQRLMTNLDGVWYVMLNASLQEDSYSLHNQNKAARLIQNSINKVQAEFMGTKILASGMLFYAQAGVKAAEHDITLIGLGSLIGIVLLMLLTFKSITPLLGTLFSTLISFIVAVAVTHLIFGSIYLFTLVMGASLLGISVDYAFFFYADRLVSGINWDSGQGLKNILSGISLGLLNILIAYVILAFTPFPALRQLALFAIVGLALAYATVVAFLPLITYPIAITKKPLLLRMSDKYLVCCTKVSKYSFTIIVGVILIFALSGIFRLHINDDIRILESMPQNLKQTEQQVKKVIGSDLGMNFIVVRGNSPEQTLEHESRVTSTIERLFPDQVNKYMAINAYLPSISEQTENFQLQKTRLINSGLVDYLQTLGMSKVQAQTTQHNLAAIQFQPLTLENWLGSPVSKAMRFLWLGQIEQDFVSIVLLSDKLEFNVLQTAITQFGFAAYINKATEISALFKSYRTKISIVLLIIYAGLFLLLLLRYSWKKARYYFLPPALASAISLGVLGWLGIPLTLFSILALVLIFGIAVDYVLFFAETKENYSGTMLATTLSAIATMLSFGLLAFSATPVLHYFGVTVLVGIGCALLLTPLFLQAAKETSKIS